MSLLEFESPKKLIGSLKDERIDQFVIKYHSEIDTVASVLSIDPSYLSVQVRILLPFYSKEILLNTNEGEEIRLIREVLKKLRYSLSSFEEHYLKFRELNGITDVFSEGKVLEHENCIRIVTADNTYNLHFGLVDPSIGFEIQDRLHYIHKSRKDTKFHFGVFLEGYNYPICYCSVSPCDRKYQINSLSKALDIPIDNGDVYVVTRAFGFTPLPHNMMSKLFDHAVKHIKNFHRNDEKYPSFLITALNPFLGFNGGIFLGSNYTPYATSPMEYRYTEKGLYLNRRNANMSIVEQSYQTPPILWLACPLTNKANKILQRSKKYYQIDLSEYKAG